MKKPFLRGLSALLMLVLMLPTLAISPLADNGEDADAAVGESAGPMPSVTLEGAERQLLYATVTLEDGTSYTTADADAAAGSADAKYVTLATARAAEARLCTPLGLRYVTALSAADYASLAADAEIGEIRVGTLIVPFETAVRAGGVTHEALAGEAYADVPATPDAWYAESDGTLYFAGSLVEIKEQNRNLPLVGVGYLSVTLNDGTAYTVYGADLSELSATTLAAEAKITLRDASLNESEVHFMTLFANSFDGNMDVLYKRDFAKLNVLAIGDSLFSGAYETVGDKVWVNLLGKRYSWNLTNLGVGGATISYDPDRTATNASIYEMLLNDADYVFGSSAYYSAGAPSGDPAEVDLILLEGGSNDYGPTVGALQGGITSTDPTTFLGGWQMITEELLHRYPNATVVFVTTWENVDQEREDGASAKTYTSSVKLLYKNVYKNNSRVYLIDAGDPDVSGVDMVNVDGTPNAEFKSQYAYDQYHLNDAGMELVAGNMLPLLWDVVAASCRTPKSEREQMRHDLSSLNVLAIGDSLFYGAGNTTRKDVWVNALGIECNWNLTNLGIGGATISYDPDRTATNASMYGMLMNDEGYKFGSRSNSYFYNSGCTAKSKDAVDVILLEAGSNDYGTKVQAPLGTLDSTDPATFLGAWKLTTEELLRQYPNAIVILVTAWENNNQTREDGANAIEYTSSVVTLYNELYADNDRVYLLDAGDPAVSGVDMRSADFKSVYAYDAFHLNDEGMALMAENMFPLIWDIIKNQAKIR
ncbi:MAG: SGNH/GDSL hydrolase family protein [Clostridia bacterium]|nr:SGNH/GDSL hydrolase family protein [Clostridia bacterium]